MLPVIQVIELDETISPYKALSAVQGLLQLRSSLESRKQQSAESTHLAELMKGKRASLSIRIDQGKKWDARLINNSGLYGKCFYSSILSLSPGFHDESQAFFFHSDRFSTLRNQQLLRATVPAGRCNPHHWPAPAQVQACIGIH